MLIEANMTEQEREIDNEIQQLKDRILLLDKEVGFYAIKINKLYEKIKRGV